MDAYTALILGMISFCFTFLFLSKNFENKTFRRGFFILFLLMFISATAVTMDIAENASLTSTVTILNGIYIGGLALTTFFIMYWMAMLALEVVKGLTKNKLEENDEEDY